MKFLITLFLLSGVPFLGCEYDGGFIKFPFLGDYFTWLKISTYGIMMALGFLTANFLLQKEFYRLNIEPKLADNIIILAVIGGIVGAKVFFLWESSAEWHGWSGFKHMAFSGGGLTWYGGFTGAATAIIAYIYKKKLSLGLLSDVLTPISALGYTFGRMGCFVSGDGCYGQVCAWNMPFPMCATFPHGAMPTTEMVYNTPLYEGLFSLVLFLIFWKYRTKEWPLGFRFPLFLIFHSIARFLVEYIRVNPKDVLGLTQAQFVSVVICTGAIVYFIARRNDLYILFNRGNKNVRN